MTTLRGPHIKFIFGRQTTDFSLKKISSKWTPPSLNLGFYFRYFFDAALDPCFHDVVSKIVPKSGHSEAIVQNKCENWKVCLDRAGSHGLHMSPSTGALRATQKSTKKYVFQTPCFYNFSVEFWWLSDHFSTWFGYLVVAISGSIFKPWQSAPDFFPNRTYSSSPLGCER